MGVIDESYCGDNDQWFFPAYALRDTKISKNDRICQFRIMEHQPAILFEETDSLDHEDRGGIGSTGRRQKAWKTDKIQNGAHTLRSVQDRSHAAADSAGDAAVR